MKNKLVTFLTGDSTVGKILSAAGKFYIAHESAILTAGTIGFSLATTTAAIKNSGKMNCILQDARIALSQCNTKEEKNDVYKLFIKQMAPLALQIFIFQAATIACAVANKRHSDKLESKLAEAVGALSIAQTAIGQYQSFAKEAEDALGPEKIHDIQKEIADNTVYEASMSPVNTKQTDDDQLIYEPITGQLIWSTPERINTAWEKYRYEVMSSEEPFVSVGAAFFDYVGADSRTCAADVFGYYNEDASKMSDKVYLDSTKVVVNGKEMSALKINYYPSIRLVTEEVFD